MLFVVFVPLFLRNWNISMNFKNALPHSSQEFQDEESTTLAKYPGYSFNQFNGVSLPLAWLYILCSWNIDNMSLNISKTRRHIPLHNSVVGKKCENIHLIILMVVPNSSSDIMSFLVRKIFKACTHSFSNNPRVNEMLPRVKYRLFKKRYFRGFINYLLLF